MDFCSLVFLVEVFHLWYVAAAACGAFVGAITNFMMGRHWSFMASEGQASVQAFRYALVSATSLGLNCGGVYLFTDHFGFKYTLSKVITAMLVGICFNFPLQRIFVFRVDDAATSPR